MMCRAIFRGRGAAAVRHRLERRQRECLASADDTVGVSCPRLRDIVAVLRDQAPARARFDGRDTFRQRPDLPPPGRRAPLAIAPDKPPFRILRQGIERRRVDVGGGATWLRHGGQGAGDQGGAGQCDGPAEHRALQCFTSRNPNPPTVCAGERGKPDRSRYRAMGEHACLRLPCSGARSQIETWGAWCIRPISRTGEDPEFSNRSRTTRQLTGTASALETRSEARRGPRCDRSHSRSDPPAPGRRGMEDRSLSLQAMRGASRRPLRTARATAARAGCSGGGKVRLCSSGLDGLAWRQPMPGLESPSKDARHVCGVLSSGLHLPIRGQDRGPGAANRPPSPRGSINRRARQKRGDGLASGSSGTDAAARLSVAQMMDRGDNKILFYLQSLAGL